METEHIWDTRSFPVWESIAGIPLSLWMNNFVSEKTKRGKQISWRTNVTMKDLSKAAEIQIVTEVEDSSYERCLYIVGENTLVFGYRNHSDGFVNWWISGEPKDVEQTEKLLRDLAPPRKTKKKQEIPIVFWNMSANGPKALSRDIFVPKWSQITHNYNQNVREGLAHLVNGFEPSLGGQLILFHGIPGTGKTWSIRALMSEWREWCTGHYIVDPETFFGSRSDYMMDVLLDDDQYNYHGRKVKDGWKCLILEDTGELLSADAKQKTGQALSRLLNVVDGLIGQGLRVLLLVTTNDELSKLHPAVSRPGRCASEIKFGKLNQDEIREWYESQKKDQHEQIKSSANLAELYGEVEGFQKKHVGDHNRLGFAAVA